MLAANPPAVLPNQFLGEKLEMPTEPAITGKEKYDDYYSDGRQEEWRRLCAKAKADNIVELCSGIPHSNLLEIGCGSGAILEQLDQRKFGQSLCGIEISSSGVEQLTLKQISSLAEAKLFDGKIIPYDDHSFDLAILSHVVEHLEYPRALLQEAKRVARFVFVEVPLEHTLRLKPDFDFNEIGHINFFTATTIRRLLQTSGLKVQNQIVTDTTREMLVFQKGRIGVLQHIARRLSFRLWPGMAQQVFVYHSALLAKSMTS